MKSLLLLCILFGATLSAYSQSTPTSKTAVATDVTAESLVQKQLEAYNARDIDAFLATYADDVELYDLPDKLILKGKDAMRKDYGAFFNAAKSLRCEIVNRIVLNNTVIDHEKVTVNPQKPASQAVAIYKVENGLIKKVYFTQ
ncbi:nuclear transport factor 2 family protein [Spirosoma sp.]|uniref:nuclear transport factor 2 family protein n=1 Tax=Spirosoma sp. TaxID=1899569 RepID=UPI003B3A829F